MNRGLTLIELLIVIAILSIIIAGIFAVLNVADISWYMDMGIMDLQQQARHAMESMVKEIRQSRAADITISEAGARIAFKIPLDITSEPITYSEIINYYRNSGNQIIREYPSEPDKVLANDINSLNFSLAGNIVEIQVSAQKTVRNRTLSFPLSGSLTEQVRLRNE